MADTMESCAICGETKLRHMEVFGVGLVCPGNCFTYKPESTEVESLRAERDRAKWSQTGMAYELTEAEARIRRLEEALQDIVIRCREGIPSRGWLPIIDRIATAALASTSVGVPSARKPEPEARLREALERWVAVYTNALQTDHERLRGLTSQRARGEETCLGFTPVYEAYLAARAALAGKPEHPGEEEK